MGLRFTESGEGLDRGPGALQTGAVSWAGSVSADWKVAQSDISVAIQVF